MVQVFEFEEKILLFIDPDTDVFEFDIGSLAMILKGDPSLGSGILFIMIRKLGKDHAVNLLNNCWSLGYDHQIIPAVFLVGRLHFLGIRHFPDTLGSILGIDCFLSGKGQFAPVFFRCLGVVPQAHLGLGSHFHLVPA